MQMQQSLKRSFSTPLPTLEPHCSPPGTAPGPGLRPQAPGRSRNGDSSSQRLARHLKGCDAAFPGHLTKTMSARMRLDASLPAATLSLRLNRQNIMNEIVLMKGTMVSAQAFKRAPALPSSAGPLVIERPAHASEAFMKKMEEKIARGKAMEAARVARREKAQAQARKKTLLGDDLLEFGQHHNQPAASTTVGGGATGLSAEEEELQREVTKLLEDDAFAMVFQAFENENGSGLETTKVDRALACLGMADCHPNCVQDAMNKWCSESGSQISLDDFAKIVVSVRQTRREEMEQLFKDMDEDSSGAIDVRELRRFLWGLGYTVSTEAVASMIDEVDGDGSGVIEYGEFEGTVDMIYSRHGFTREERDELLDLYERFDIDGDGEVSAIELAGLLNYYGTPTTLQNANKIIVSFDSDGSGSLCKPEFLRAMRSRLEQDIADARSLFAAYDADMSGEIEGEEMVDLVHRLGYIILPEVLDEISREVAKGKSGLVFEDLFKVINFIRSQEGFSSRECNQLKNVFDKFDRSKQGEMREFELTLALNWLGYPVTPALIGKLWIRVDVDKSGNIDHREWLKVLRIMRECDTEYIQQVLNTKTKKLQPNEAWTWLEEEGIEDILRELGYKLHILHDSENHSFDAPGQVRMLNSASRPPTVVSILKILQVTREAQCALIREYHGLSMLMIQKVRNKLDKKDTLNAAVLQRAMAEMFKIKDASESGEQLRMFVEGKLNTEATISRSTAYAIISEYCEKRDEDAWLREREAASNCNFLAYEVADLREAFVKFDDDNSGSLDEFEIMELFNKLMEMRKSQRSRLKKAVAALGEKASSIDFAEFLNLVSIVRQGRHHGRGGGHGDD
eukprot:TRINITY_DN17755_c0_g2_i1.p1 TRINITY_DN17755_c0_g2~~TRINITY_DN17755_c0_g2_i1.p1  ORF type:complete len:852 (-),score=258.00 TRINITY_DN17755_c0_g2_i1:234-2789(-)